MRSWPSRFDRNWPDLVDWLAGPKQGSGGRERRDCHDAAAAVCTCGDRGRHPRREQDRHLYTVLGVSADATEAQLKGVSTAFPEIPSG